MLPYWAQQAELIAAVGQANGAKPQTVSGSFRNAATMTDILLDMKLEPFFFDSL